MNRAEKAEFGFVVVIALILFLAFLAAALYLPFSPLYHQSATGAYSIDDTNSTVVGIDLSLTSDAVIGNVSFVFTGTFNWSLTHFFNTTSVHFHAVLPQAGVCPTMCDVSSYAKTPYWTSQLQVLIIVAYNSTAVR